MELREIEYRVATTTLPLLVMGEAIQLPAPWQDIRLCVRVEGWRGPFSKPVFRHEEYWIIDHYATGWSTGVSGPSRHKAALCALLALQDSGESRARQWRAADEQAAGFENTRAEVSAVLREARKP
jgi:hypothetical protein